MHLKKILYTLVFLCFLLPDIHAQEVSNKYETLIQDLESRGINVAAVLNNKDLLDKITDFDIIPDSLRYYFNQKNIAEGRDTLTVNKGYIPLLAKSYGDSVVLRWAPSTIDLWNSTRIAGYKLVRMTQFEQDIEGSMVPNIDYFSRVVLVDSLTPLLPWTLDSISKVVTSTDTMALIAAQAMYGTSFSPNMNTDNQDFLDRHKEKILRFGFSLLMADRSVLAAEVMGLRYTDTTVVKGRKYVYGIYPMGEDPDMGSLAFVSNDPTQNNKVEGIVAEEGESEIKLFWPKNQNKFSGYWLERSADNGKSWKKLTSQPLVFVEQSNKQGQQPEQPVFRDEADREGPILNPIDYYIFIDSVANYIPYTYRLSGQTPFADFSNYGFATGTAGDLTPPPMPQVSTYEVDEESGIASLVWTMDYESDLLDDLAGFTVWQAPRRDSTFVQISQLLPPNTRSYNSPQALDREKSHYYILKAVDDKGNAVSSYPMYMHLADDIPPAAPREPAYLIDDSTGVVTLLWIANEEKDLAGYRVYFSNSLSSEFTQLTSAPINKNIFYDTIKLITLSEKIYYKFQAVDDSHNRSLFSEVLTVKRPDYVPPITPVMEHPKVTAKYIQLSWRPSSSIDVVKQILYRRPYGKEEEEWQVLNEFNDPAQNNFVDTSTQVENLYEYTMKALDDAGLYSDYAFPVKGRRWFDEEIATVKNLQVAYDSTAQVVQLSWQFQAPDYDILKDVDYQFYIYRSIGDLSPIRYRMLDSKNTTFSDLKIKKDGQYHYAVKVVFVNGKASPLTEQKSVLVKRKN